MPIPFMAIHTCRVSVTNVSSYTISFPDVFGASFYGKTPKITAMTESATEGDTNCHVDNIDLTAQTALIRFSAHFTGHVHVTAIVT